MGQKVTWRWRRVGRMGGLHHSLGPATPYLLTCPQQKGPEWALPGHQVTLPQLPHP